MSRSDGERCTVYTTIIVYFKLYDTRRLLFPCSLRRRTRTDGHRLRAITHLTFYSKPLYCVLRFANGRRKLGGLMRHDSESYLSDSPCNCDASNCTRRPGLAIEFLPQVSLVLVGRVLQYIIMKVKQQTPYSHLRLATPRVA